MIQLEPIYEPIEKDLIEVESILSRVATDLKSGLAQEVQRALSSRGKRLRPALLLICCRAVGGNRDASRAAAAVELVHSAALLHDDVVDHAVTRRGAATAGAKLGRSMSVVLGNYLYSRAFGLMPDHDGLRHQLSVATAEMCSGEALELARRGDLSVTIGDYMNTAARKTASLISACCAIGSRLALGEVRTVNSLAAYGLLLGLAFQIRDDCLDMKGDTESMGKGVCRDFTERNVTLPLILALPRMQEKERREISEMFKGRMPINTERFVDTVDRHGGIDDAMQVAFDFTERAASFLAHLPESGARDSLRLLAAYSVDRES